MKITTLTTMSEGAGLVTTVHATVEAAYQTLASEVTDADSECPLAEGASIDEVIEAANALPQFAFDVREHDLAVEILHGRDPDSSCEMDVWINGVRVDKVTVESVDPGAGYEVEMWDEHTEQRVASDDTYSSDFRDAVVANRTEARNSQYIVGDKDAPGPYTLHYTSADGPGPDATWSVYREQYPSLEGSDGEPIDGSQEKVSTHDTEALADAEADRLQKS